MVRARRAVRKPRAKRQQEYDSDDPDAYKDNPDKNSSTYVEDKIDEFHKEKISNLLARGVQEDSDQEDGDKAEEIMPLTISESEDDEGEEEQEDDNKEETDMESDLEGKKDDDLPNEMAWGEKKKIFYNSDYVTKKGKSLEEVEAEDKEEEEEAKSIQKRLAANLSEEDYDLNMLEEFAANAEVEKDVEKEERIVKDLKTMSQKEKLKLLKKESPELLELIQDFKAKLTELKDEVQPLVEMVKDGRIPPGKGAKYLIMKQQLYLNYCTNISFYLVLKAKRIPAHNHPVIERLLTYRNLINELGAVDARLAPQLRQLLFGEQQDRTARRSAGSKDTKVSEEAKLEEEERSDSDEEANLRFYNAMAERQKLKRKKTEMPNEDGLVEEEQMEGDAKRRITYQMSKNKGLTPKRKKIDRNPRVKHREKFRRAQIRRKGQVREVRREETRYSGEWSGIRAGVKRSVKFK
ncbi:something about silencing protein 10 [Pimephales promelas]|uniref:something about silencing protein 10 n=1 Tax=Pimephales promelas TaxID=90988 RepID=UPI00195577E6|nr:something about silencing protein 10 [Pimephales promelas]KAG1949650.1 something about silencing protein [Pimephales promelas]